MAIDKSLKQHYETQAGVKNFLGKQKMVKAPKYWLSKPGHVKAKLAYITDEEEQILIDKNLYGSLRGRPNKGPAGLPSLQGGDYGAGGGGSSGGGGGGGGGGGQDRWDWSPAPAPAPTPSPHRDDSAERAAQAAADALNAAREAEARESAREKAIQVAALTPKTIEPVRSPHSDTPLQVLEQQILDTTKPTTPDILPEFKKRGITTVTGGSPHTEGPIDRIVYQPTDLPKRTYDPRTDPNALLQRGSGITGGLKTAGKGILEMALMPFLPKPVRTAWSGYKRAKQLEGLAKTTGILDKDIVPTLNLSNLRSSIDKGISGRQFDPKDPIGWTGEQKRTKTFHEPKGDGEATIAQQVSGSENVIAKAINQYRGTEAEAQIANLVKTNLNQALQYYSMMTPKIEAGKANKQEMDAYELLGYYLNEAAPKQQNLAYGGRIDKALTGRSRDI